MTEALVHRLTVEEYYRLAESGVLRPDARTELLDGQIIDMFPIGPFHSDVVDWIAELFTSYNRERWIPRSQGPLHLDPHSVPQPDLMLLRRRRYHAGLPRPKDVFLLIEVADTSLRSDQVDKLPLYAKAGIAEVWIVDVPHTRVEIYREPTPAGYGVQMTAEVGGTVSPIAFPDVVLSVAEIFDV